MSQPLRWTTVKPTEAGFYYHRGVKSDEAQVVQVVPQNGGFGVRYPGDRLEYTIPSDDDRGYHGEWAGPITPPERGEARAEGLRDAWNATSGVSYPSVNGGIMSQPLRWTTKRPTVAGWYWWRSMRNTESISYHIGVWKLGKADFERMERWGSSGEWAGPIEPPQQGGCC